MTEAANVRRIRLAAAIVAAQAAAIVALAVAELAHLDSDRPSVALTSAGFFFAYALGLAWAAWGLYRLRTWSRGPVVLAQLIELGVAWSFYGNDTKWLAALLVVPAILVLVIAFSPSTTDTLYGARGDDENLDRAD